MQSCTYSIYEYFFYLQLQHVHMKRRNSCSGKKNPAWSFSPSPDPPTHLLAHRHSLRLGLLFSVLEKLVGEAEKEERRRRKCVFHSSYKTYGMVRHRVCVPFFISLSGGVSVSQSLPYLHGRRRHKITAFTALSGDFQSWQKFFKRPPSSSLFEWRRETVKLHNVLSNLKRRSIYLCLL